MDARLPAGLALGALLGFGLGALWSGPSALEPTPAAPPTAPAEDCPDCPACPDQVCPGEEAPVDLPEVVFEERGAVPPGPIPEPTPWPEDLPEEVGLEAQRASLEELAEACGFADDLYSIDCSSPPCMAAVAWPTDSDKPPLGGNCPEWVDRWGPAVTSASSESLCEDGSRRYVALVGPMPPELAEALPPKDPDDPWASMRGFQARTDQVREAIGCGRPASLTVDNRPGHKLQWVPTGD